MFIARFIFNNLEEILSAILLAAMACLAFANVITRYVFEYPLAFTEELEVNALVWLTLFGTASAFRRKRHLSMLFFQEKMPRKVRFAIHILIILLAIGLFAALGYLGYLQLIDERELEITSESLGLPQWFYTTSIPAGCALILFRILQIAVRDIRRMR